MRKRVAVEYL